MPLMEEDYTKGFLQYFWSRVEECASGTFSSIQVIDCQYLLLINTDSRMYALLVAIKRAHSTGEARKHPRSQALTNFVSAWFAVSGVPAVVPPRSPRSFSRPHQKQNL